MEEEEIWKPIKDFEGFYLINKDGDIKSVERWIYLKNHSYIRREQDIIKALDKTGYYKIKVYNNTKKTKTIGVHRLVALTYLDNPSNYPCINHINGIKTDNRVENLEWCTASYNNTHAYRTGLKDPKTYQGSANGTSKLTEEEVISIRKEYKTGLITYKILANKYNVGITLIGYIVNRKIWKHV